MTVWLTLMMTIYDKSTDKMFCVRSYYDKNQDKYSGQIDKNGMQISRGSHLFRAMIV